MRKETVQLAASGVHGLLLFFRAVVYRRSPAFMDSVPKEPFRSSLSERGIVVQVADDLSAQRPEVVDVLVDGLG
jgi:hypothetical protein